MTINRQTVEQLKSAGHHFAAGALAYELKMERDSYGCHYGMKSDLPLARATFKLGWDAAEKEA